MSADDMVFGDVQYREPVRATRPDRDRELACLAYEVPGAEDLPIFLDRKAADAIERHALRDTSVELGGILLGQECVDEKTGRPFVRVTHSLEAKHYENTQASFTYTHDSWEEITRERDRLYPGLDIVGWYHTHPDFGIFLSSHDLFIHRNFFAQPLQVAYVVDPIRQTRGFFQWRDDRLDQVGGYYLTSDRDDRIALARLVNDLESIPNADGGGGALSPRLEAELIAMLTRPHQAAMSPADRAQAAATFGVLGLFAGALLAVGVAWLYTLHQSLAKQTETLEKLQTSVSRTDDTQRVALDALLARGEPGVDSKSFLTRYRELLSKNDALDMKLRDQETQAHVLTAEARRLEAELKAQTEAKTKALARADSQDATIAEQKQAIEALTKTDSGKAIQNYQIAWYAAVGGWITALLAGLGLIGTWAARTPPASPPDDAPKVIYTPQEPPHSIT